LKRGSNAQQEIEGARKQNEELRIQKNLDAVGSERQKNKVNLRGEGKKRRKMKI